MVGHINLSYSVVQGPVSAKIVSLETDLSLLIIMAAIVVCMLKITSGFKNFRETGPW